MEVKDRIESSPYLRYVFDVIDKYTTEKEKNLFINELLKKWKDLNLLFIMHIQNTEMLNKNR